MSVPNVGRTHYRDGGTRGGRDQFNWDDVKTETYRENYIGHSLKAPVGLHYKKKDHLWWTKGNDPSPLAQVKTSDDASGEKKRKKHKKEKKKHKKSKKKKSRRRSDSEDSVQGSEKQALKKHDEELMAQALGLSTKQSDESSTQKLDSRDMKVLLARGNEDFERTETDGERIKGLGAGFSKKHDLVDPSISQRGGEATYFIEGSAAPTPSKASHVEETRKDTERKRKKHKHKHKHKKRRRRHDSSGESEDEEEKRLHKLRKKNQSRFY